MEVIINPFKEGFLLTVKFKTLQYSTNYDIINNV